MPDARMRPVLRFWKLPFEPAGSSQAKLRMYADRAVWEQYVQKSANKRKAIFRTLAWPATSLVQSAKQARQFGSIARANGGPNIFAQFLTQWMVATRWLVHPSLYYQFGMYLGQRRKRAAHFLTNKVSRILIQEVNSHAPEWQKPWFDECCRNFGLPHVEVLNTFDDGEVTPAIATTDLPQADLFTKPAAMYHGLGVERWRFRNGVYINSLDQKFEPSVFISHLKQLSIAGPVVLQRAVENHPAIAAISNGSLCTVRVMTGLRKGYSEAELIFASLRMSVGHSLVDNFSAGGIAAPVNAKTGTLGAAVAKSLFEPHRIHHPDTGGRIEGRVLPYWNECASLCLLAHRKFSPIAIVGWDVAITPDGPLLLEGNLTCCVELLQMSHGRPIGDTPYANVIESHLEGGSH